MSNESSYNNTKWIERLVDRDEETGNITQRRIGESPDTPYRESREDVTPDTSWFSGEIIQDSPGNTGEYSYSPPPTLGVYVSDTQNDGFPDLLTVDSEYAILYENLSSTPAAGESISSLGDKEQTYNEQGNRIYTSQDESYSGALFFDYDNDGWEDLLLLKRSGKPVFFENEGGKFVEHDVGFGKDLRATRGATAADYTGNGCLDVLIIQDGSWENTSDIDKIRESLTGPGARNRLFAGDCKSFEKTTDEAGLRGGSWSMATSFVDLTNDGYPDIHVANLFGEDVIYINQGDGTFDRRLISKTYFAGMSSTTVDLNADNYTEVYVTNVFTTESEIYNDSWQPPTNSLLMNNGSGGFKQTAQRYGIEKSGWGWSASFADFSNDGMKELVVGTSAYDDLRWIHPAVWERGNRSTEYELAYSPPDHLITEGYGLATFDYNRDGRLDTVESASSGEFVVNTNVMEGNSYLSVDVRGSPNQTAIGTRVYVKTDDGVQTETVTSGSDFMSQSSRVLHFGLGETENVERVTAEFPDGTRTVLTDVEANQLLRIEHTPK